MRSLPLILAAGALLLASRGAGASASVTGAPNTGAPPGDAWIRSRWEEARAQLAAAGYAPELAARIAAALVAQWGHETGWGRAEWGHNVGNMKTGGAAWQGATWRYGTDVYRAYPTLAAGIADHIRLLRSGRYAAAWQLLAQGDDGNAWHDAILRAGWHPWSQTSVDEYRSERARVARVTGA